MRLRRLFLLPGIRFQSLMVSLGPLLCTGDSLLRGLPLETATGVELWTPVPVLELWDDQGENDIASGSSRGSQPSPLGDQSRMNGVAPNSKSFPSVDGSHGGVKDSARGLGNEFVGEKATASGFKCLRPW